MTATGAIRPCVRGIFAGPAAEAVWGISDPKRASRAMWLTWSQTSPRGYLCKRQGPPALRGKISTRLAIVTKEIAPH
jgi:hypothetical protein